MCFQILLHPSICTHNLVLFHRDVKGFLCKRLARNNAYVLLYITDINLHELLTIDDIEIFYASIST